MPGRLQNKVILFTYRNLRTSFATQGRYNYRRRIVRMFDFLSIDAIDTILVVSGLNPPFCSHPRVHT